MRMFVARVRRAEKSVRFSVSWLPGLVEPRPDVTEGRGVVIDQLLT